MAEGFAVLLVGAALIYWGWKGARRKVWWYIVGAVLVMGSFGAFEGTPTAATGAPPAAKHHHLTAAQKKAIAARDLAAKRRAFLSWWRPLDADVNKADSFYQPIVTDFKAYTSNPSGSDSVQFYGDAKQAADNLWTLKGNVSLATVPSEDAYVGDAAYGYVDAIWTIANELPADINDRFTIAQTSQLKSDLQTARSSQSALWLAALNASKGLNLSLTQLFPSH